MPRRKRGTFFENCFYHVLNRGNNKQRIFRDAQDHNFFMQKFFNLIDESKIDPIIFVVMRTHFHVMLMPERDSDVSKFMLRLCTSYAQYYKKKYSYIGYIFQGRFKSKLIMTENGVENVFNYILNNPVKEGYCEDPDDYAWIWIKDPNKAGQGTGLIWDRPGGRWKTG